MAQSGDSLTRWAVGVGLSALLLAAGWGVMGVKDKAEAAFDLAHQVKTDAEVIKAKAPEVERRLERMEEKLDYLIARDSSKEKRR